MAVRPLFPLMLAFAAALPAAATAADYTEDAADAANTGARAVTVYVDVTFGMRKNVAARELNDAHRAFGDQGYAPVAVTAHEENGDLQGFFVTYRRD